MDKIVIIGGGGHAKVIISILKKLRSFDIVGYTDIENNGPILGIQFLGGDDILKDLLNKKVKNAVIGIGQIKRSQIRERAANYAISAGFKFPAIIAPTAMINEEVIINSGAVIMDGVVLNSGTNIGQFSIVNTKASIDHDCKIGNFVHVAPGVTLSGGVKVGNYTLIGAGSSVIQNVIIESNCIIGAGSAVMKNCVENSMYVGVPAKRFSRLKHSKE